MAIIPPTTMYIPKGTTYVHVFTYPADLTGYEIKMDIRDYAGAPDPALWAGTLLAGDFAIDVVDSVTTLTLTIEDTVTTAWTWWDAVFDIEIKDVLGDGSKDRIARGYIDCSPEVTTA